MKTVYRLGQGLVRLLILLIALLGILILARVIFLFFGGLKTLPGYEIIVNLTKPFVFPIPAVERIKTPYAGEFDLPAVVSLLLILVLESFLGIFQGILGRRILRGKED